MGRFGLGRESAELRDGFGELALHHLGPADSPALASVESVADRGGDVTSFFTGCAGRDRLTSEIAAAACRARIWLSLHRSLSARARPSASAKHARVASVS